MTEMKMAPPDTLVEHAVKVSEVSVKELDALELMNIAPPPDLAVQEMKARESKVTAFSSSADVSNTEIAPPYPSGVEQEVNVMFVRVTG